MPGTKQSTELPPILVLQHYKENLRKCSLRGLRKRPGFEFRTIEPVYPNPHLEVEGGILLIVDEPELETSDRHVFKECPAAPLIIIDGTWTKIRSVTQNIFTRERDATLLRRSLPSSITTAYPRRSKLYDDPGGGLASIEALVAALHVLGYPALDLLEGYHWQREFLESNREFFGG